MNKKAEKASREIIPLETINSVEIFDGNGKALDALLARIEEDALALVPDVTTKKGRDEIASTAWNVRRSKATIDKARKKFGEDLRDKLAGINAAGNRATIFLDDVAARVRKPLDEWQAAEAERVRKEQEEAELLRLKEEAAAQFERDWTDAIAEDRLRDREAAVKAEEERQRKERERLEAEEAERIREKEEAERIRKANEELEERLKNEAEAKLEAERQEKLQAQRKAEEAEERRKCQAEEAERVAKEAAERAARELEAATRKATEEAEQAARDKEDRRLAEERRRTLEEEERARDLKHRQGVNEAIENALAPILSSQELPKKIRQAIAEGLIPRVSIDYGRAASEPTPIK